MREKKKIKNEPEEIHVQKLSGFSIRKIGMILVWIILIFIFLRGIIAIFTSVSPSEQKRTFDEYINTLNLEENLKGEASTFAENFVKNYFTYDGKNKDNYDSRMANFTATGLIITAPEDVETTVNYISSTSVNFLSEEAVDVDVIVEVKYSDNIKLFKITVPIEIDSNGKMAVVNYPQFIPNEDKSEEISAYQKTLPGRDINKDELSEIQTNLESFFKTYFEGNDNELSYYVTKSFPYKQGLRGLIQFNSITALRVSFDENNDRFYAVANLEIVDNGRHLEQVCYLELIETDRFYIDNISTR